MESDASYDPLESSSNGDSNDDWDDSDDSDSDDGSDDSDSDDNPDLDNEEVAADDEGLSQQPTCCLTGRCS